MLYPLSVVKTQQMALANAPRGLRVRAPPRPGPPAGTADRQLPAIDNAQAAAADTSQPRQQQPRTQPAQAVHKQQQPCQEPLARVRSSSRSTPRQACTTLWSLLQLEAPEATVAR